MPSNNYLGFKKVEFYGKPDISRNIEVNLKHYFDWAFLKIGAWAEVTSSSSGVYGGNFYTLKNVDDEGYDDYTVYESIRKDWVYETGVNFESDMQYDPIEPVIYSGGVPHSGDYIINYPLGRVIFNDSQSGVNITADYSYRLVQTYLSDDQPWFYELQFDSMNPADLHWTQNVNSGDFSVPSQHRIQLPAIVIESTTNGRIIKPYDIGPNINNIVYENCKFSVISQTKKERDNIIDILTKQNNSSFWLYDEAAVNMSGVYSLDYNGDINPSGLNYPELVTNDSYKYKNVRIDSIATNNIKSISPDLHIGNVIWKLMLIV